VSTVGQNDRLRLTSKYCKTSIDQNILIQMSKDFQSIYKKLQIIYVKSAGLRTENCKEGEKTPSF